MEVAQEGMEVQEEAAFIIFSNGPTKP